MSVGPSRLLGRVHVPGQEGACSSAFKPPQCSRQGAGGDVIPAEGPSLGVQDWVPVGSDGVPAGRLISRPTLSLCYRRRAHRLDRHGVSFCCRLHLELANGCQQQKGDWEAWFPGFLEALRSEDLGVNSRVLECSRKQKTRAGGFPGDPVAKTPHSQWKVPRSTPELGN